MAAIVGKLVLKWTIENKCDLNWKVYVIIAKERQLKVLKWARKNGYDWN